MATKCTRTRASAWPVGLGTTCVATLTLPPLTTAPRATLVVAVQACGCSVGSAYVRHTASPAAFASSAGALGNVAHRAFRLPMRRAGRPWHVASVRHMPSPPTQAAALGESYSTQLHYNASGNFTHQMSCDACIRALKRGYHTFVNVLHRQVIKAGRQSIVWEGFDPDPSKQPKPPEACNSGGGGVRRRAMGASTRAEVQTAGRTSWRRPGCIHGRTCPGLIALAQLTSLRGAPHVRQEEPPIELIDKDIIVAPFVRLPPPAQAARHTLLAPLSGAATVFSVAALWLHCRTVATTMPGIAHLLTTTAPGTWSPAACGGASCGQRTRYLWPQGHHLHALRYKILNAAWSPLYVCGSGGQTAVEHIALWDPTLFGGLVPACAKDAWNGRIVFVCGGGVAEKVPMGCGTQHPSAGLSALTMCRRARGSAAGVSIPRRGGPVVVATLCRPGAAPTPVQTWQRLPEDNWFMPLTQSWDGGINSWPINSAHQAQGGQAPPMPAQVVGAEMCLWAVRQDIAEGLLFAPNCTTRHLAGGRAAYGRPEPRVAVMAERAWGSSNSPDNLLERAGCSYW